MYPFYPLATRRKYPPLRVPRRTNSTAVAHVY